jgi:hypothetical protein
MSFASHTHFTATSPSLSLSLSPSLIDPIKHTYPYLYTTHSKARIGRVVVVQYVQQSSTTRSTAWCVLLDVQLVQACYQHSRHRGTNKPPIDCSIMTLHRDAESHVLQCAVDIMLLVRCSTGLYSWNQGLPSRSYQRSTALSDTPAMLGLCKPVTSLASCVAKWSTAQ